MCVSPIHLKEIEKREQQNDKNKLHPQGYKYTYMLTLMHKRLGLLYGRQTKDIQN